MLVSLPLRFSPQQKVCFSYQGFPTAISLAFLANLHAVSCDVLRCFPLFGTADNEHRQ